MSDADWDAVMRPWDEAIDRHKISGANKSDLVQVFAKYRGDIMGRK
jgi:hypothetical protein